MSVPPPGSFEGRCRRRVVGQLAARGAQRRHRRRLRPRTLRQCAHPAHHGYSCAAEAGLFPRAQRQSRHRRDGGQAAASGRESLPRALRHPPRQRRRLCLHLHRIRKIRRALRQARRLCPSEDAGRPSAQRRRTRPLAAARWRRPLAGHRARQRHAGRRHGGSRKPARHRGDDRPLGIHLWRGGVAEKSRALQGRVSGAERLLDRGGGLQRRQGVRPRLGARVQAIGHQGNRRLPYRGDRAGLSLRADRASKAFHAGLEVRHPRRGTAKTGRRASRQRQGRCRDPAVA